MEKAMKAGKLISGESKGEKSSVNPVIWYFVKFFNNEVHADEFMRGNLHLKRLGYFKTMEQQKDDGRPDSREAISHWWQPNDFVMKLTVPGVGEIEIKNDDLAGPVSMSYDYHENLHVFCLYSIHTVGFEIIDGKIDYAESEGETLKKQLEVDPRNSKLGGFAVVTPATQFLDRLKSVLQMRGQYFKGRLVEYYDDKTFHGSIQPDEIPFWKQQHFSYQNEFRICINTKTIGDDPLNISVGDISDICGKIQSEKINDLLSIKSIKV